MPSSLLRCGRAGDRLKHPLMTLLPLSRGGNEGLLWKAPVTYEHVSLSLILTRSNAVQYLCLPQRPSLEAGTLEGQDFALMGDHEHTASLPFLSMLSVCYFARLALFQRTTPGAVPRCRARDDVRPA